MSEVKVTFCALKNRLLSPMSIVDYYRFQEKSMPLTLVLPVAFVVVKQHLVSYSGGLVVFDIDLRVVVKR